MAQGIKLNEEILPAEQFKAWREEGLSFEAIGKKVGYSGGAVGAYAKRVLPEHLWGRPGGGKRKPEEVKPKSMEEIRAELRKTVDRAQEKMRQKLAKKQPEPVVELEEGKDVEVPVREDIVAIRIAPLPNLQTGLFIAAGDNGTAAALVTGPGGLQDLLWQQSAHEAWCKFLVEYAEISPDGTLGGLFGMTPPRYVRDDADRWEYLRRIGAGYVVASRRVRRRVRAFLAREGQPILSRSTARWLDLLARLARWLIAQEG